MILCSNCQHGGGRVEMLEGGIKRLSLNKPQNRSDTRQLCSGTKSERGITQFQLERRLIVEGGLFIR